MPIIGVPPRDLCLICRRTLTFSQKTERLLLRKTTHYGAVCSAKCSKKFNRDKHIAWGKLAANVDSVEVFFFSRGPIRYYRYDGERATERSTFRALIVGIRQRDKQATIDAEYLNKLWVAQDGKCALSGLSMDPAPQLRDGTRSRLRDPWHVSVDRIDPRRGYVRGNVRLVCLIANIARNTFMDAQLFEFCRAVATYNSAALRTDEVPLSIADLPPLD